MDIKPYLKLMVQKQASDLYCSEGTQVHLRVNGQTIPVGKQPLGAGEAKEMIYSILDQHQILEFEDEWELNIGLPLAGIGRFRLNVFQQRGSPAMVVRHIKSIIPNIDETGLPTILKELIMEPRGLILVVGATGSGKSTTLATMLEY
ncbi:twitching motility protein PilT, partial [Achromatium sp. WMS1]